MPKATKSMKAERKAEKKSSKVPDKIRPPFGMKAEPEPAPAPQAVVAKRVAEKAPDDEPKDKPLVPADKIAIVHAERMTSALRAAGRSVVSMAREAEAVREKYGYASLVNWMGERFELSRSTCDAMLRVHTNLIAAGLDPERLEFVEPSALYLLAQNTTPAPLRKRLIEKAESAEKPLTHAVVKTELERAKARAEARRARGEQPDDEERPGGTDAPIGAPGPVRRGLVEPTDDEAAELAGEDRPTGKMPPLGNGNGAEPAAANFANDEQAALDKQPSRMIPTDNLGNPLTRDELVEVFDRVTDLDEDMKALSDLKAKIARRAKANDPLYAHVNITKFEADLENARTNLKHGLPHAICPAHADDEVARKGCRWCHGHGWVTKEKFELAMAAKKASKGKGGKKNGAAEPVTSNGSTSGDETVPMLAGDAAAESKE